MTDKPTQLAFDLACRAAMEREDYLVSPANRAAVEAIDSWPDWAQRTLAIVGPAGSGKTHLLEVWRARAGGHKVPARMIGEDTIGLASASGALAVEDIDLGIADERVLFHLFNLARETSLSLIVTSRAAPGELEIKLPDLRSRLRAMPLVSIAQPDEPLLMAMLVKLFADRQLKVGPDVIEYIAHHVGQSAEALSRVVAIIDRLALQGRRKVTRTLANEALASLAQTADE